MYLTLCLKLHVSQHFHMSILDKYIIIYKEFYKYSEDISK